MPGPVFGFRTCNIKEVLINTNEKPKVHVSIVLVPKLATYDITARWELSKVNTSPSPKRSSESSLKSLTVPFTSIHPLIRWQLLKQKLCNCLNTLGPLVLLFRFAWHLGMFLTYIYSEWWSDWCWRIQKGTWITRWCSSWGSRL